jgi:hypothetical protein
VFCEPFKQDFGERKRRNERMRSETFRQHLGKKKKKKKSAHGMKKK